MRHVGILLLAGALWATGLTFQGEAHVLLVHNWGTDAYRVDEATNQQTPWLREGTAPFIRGLALGPDGLIYLSPYGNYFDKEGGRHTGILRFTQDGRFVDTFVPSGTGGFHFGYAIGFAPNGDLITGDASSAGRIHRFDGTTGAPKGADPENPGSGLLVSLFPPHYYSANRAADIEAGPDGWMYSRFANGMVTRFDPLGSGEYEILATDAVTRSLTAGVAFDAAGYLLYPRPDGFVRYNIHTRESLGLFLALPDPGDIIMSPAGNVIYAYSQQTGYVERFDAFDGTYLGRASFTMPAMYHMVFIPEPGILCAGGFFALICLRRRPRTAPMTLIRSGATPVLP